MMSSYNATVMYLKDSVDIDATSFKDYIPLADLTSLGLVGNHKAKKLYSPCITYSGKGRKDSANTPSLGSIGRWI